MSHRHKKISVAGT